MYQPQGTINQTRTTDGTVVDKELSLVVSGELSDSMPLALTPAGLTHDTDVPDKYICESHTGNYKLHVPMLCDVAIMHTLLIISLVL